MADVKKMVDEAVSNEKAKEEQKAFAYVVTAPICGRTSLHGDFVLSSASSCNFVPSLTDQTHALSISQQVRRGQGDSEPPQKDAYDFPDGKDDGSVAHGIFEFAERADAWMAEQNLADELKASFRKQVLQKTADLAMKEQALKSSQTLENGSKIAQESKVDDKTSTSSK